MRGCCYQRGVVVAGLLLALAAAGCASLPSDEGGSSVVAEAVASRLAMDPLLAGPGVTVSEEQGVVTLRGVVANEAQRARAVSMARGTPGVKGVVDRLRVF